MRLVRGRVGKLKADFVPGLARFLAGKSSVVPRVVGPWRISILDQDSRESES